MIGDGEAVARRNCHALAQGTVGRIDTKEVVVRTQVRIALQALFAPAAGHVGLDSDAHAGFQLLAHLIFRARGRLKYAGGKLVPEQHGLIDPDSPDRACFVHVQIGPTDAH